MTAKESEIQAEAKILGSNDESSPTQRQRWLLLFNCQAAGLAHCLSLQCREIEVEVHDPASTARNFVAIADALERYDRILAAPGCGAGLKLDGRRNFWWVPSILFQAYHPDMCFLGQEFAKGEHWRMGNCHSIIAYTAFSLGLDIDQATALYREDVYADLGYFLQWELEAEAFYARYERFGFDMGGCLAKWSRKEAFMYVHAHPKIECLNDLARSILRRAGMPLTDSPLRPHDNLVAGPVFPVYPEIGRRLGVPGDYLFKVARQYRMLNLGEFVSMSYRHYASFANLTPTDPYFAEALEGARAVIAAHAGVVDPEGVSPAKVRSESSP